MDTPDFSSFLKPISEESISDDNLDFLSEVYSFPTEVMNKILFQLVTAHDHALLINDLEKNVYPKDTTGNSLDMAFRNALKILKSWNLITFDSNVARLDDGAFQLYEILNTKEDEAKPYSAFIKRKQKREENADLLLKYQVIVAQQQAELNPLIKKANVSSGKIQSSLLSINRKMLIANLAIAFGTIVAAVYYIVEIEKNFQFVKAIEVVTFLFVFLAGICIGILALLIAKQVLKKR